MLYKLQSLIREIPEMEIPYKGKSFITGNPL